MKKTPMGLPGLRAAREAFPMTQNALARALEVHDRQIMKWEHGDSDPSVHTAVAIARILSVTVEQLVEAMQ